MTARLLIKLVLLTELVPKLILLVELVSKLVLLTKLITKLSLGNKLRYQLTLLAKLLLRELLLLVELIELSLLLIELGLLLIELGLLTELRLLLLLIEKLINHKKVGTFSGIYILAIHPPPWGGGEFLSKLKNREEFGGGLEKRKGKGVKRRKQRKE